MAQATQELGDVWALETPDQIKRGGEQMTIETTKPIPTKQIGDGKLPNKYWVSMSNDYYFPQDGCWNWISDLKLFEVKSKTVTVFSTYRAAKEFVDANLSLGIEEDDIKTHCVFIEDRLSGQLYEKAYYFNPELAELKELETEDLQFTEDKMLKHGATFA